MALLIGCGRTSEDPLVTPEMLGCRELQPLAGQPVLVPWQARRVYFTPDRSFLLLQILGEPDRLVRVDLPSGGISTIVDAIASVTPLGGGRVFLLEGTGTDRNETWFYDGNHMRPLFSGFCHFTATPDGTILYAVGPCVGTENGLTRIDLATGTRLTIDPRGVMKPEPGIQVSPNGQWIAYWITDPEDNPDDSQRTIAVADAAGNVYPITSPHKVYLVAFASDNLMLFQTGCIQRQYPGESGDVSARGGRPARIPTTNLVGRWRLHPDPHHKRRAHC